MKPTTLPEPSPPRVIGTTVEEKRRMISAIRSDEKSDRYVLHRKPNGSVSWRADTFTSPRDLREQERWIAHHGELSVAQVILMLPGHAEVVRRWTHEEIGQGMWVEGSENLPVRERRLRSLERLSEELGSLAA